MEKTIRKQKAEEIVNKRNQITRINDRIYKVKSQSNNNEYDVYQTEIGWICSCPDNTFRRVNCKHIIACELSLALRKRIQKIEQINVNSCKFCNSTDFIKDATRYNKYGRIQRYRCKNCSKRFSINLGFEKMRASPQSITSAMQLYFTGESLRNVQKFLRLQGVEVSHITVYKWIKKYVVLMENYLDQINPQVSDKWRTDEIYLKIKGDKKYLYAIMDDETRFWIAKQVSDKKYMEDVRPLFKQAREIAQKKPTTLISDGANNFSYAFKKEYATWKKPRPQHIRHIHFKNDRNNNKMERLNGEIRDREKVMRGLKRLDTPIIEGYKIYHNFIRPHQGLDGKTPAQASGIEIEGQNKWITIIQNARKNMISNTN